LAVLNSTDYSYVFVIFGFTLVLFVLNNLLLSILNGLKEIKTWVKVSIFQSLYGLIFTTLLIVFLGLDGALIALVTNQSVIFLVVVWMLRRHPVIRLSHFCSAFNRSEARKLAGFALMALTSAVSLPVSLLFVRNYLGENLGWEAAGYWQAIWYVSMMYLMVVTTTLGVYYLPRLSEIQDKSVLRRELWDGFRVIMPIVVVLSLSIFLLKDLIIWLLFSKEFMPIRELFLWQLVGDVVKIAAWLFSSLLIAKAMLKTFIATEVVFSLSFVLLSIWFVDLYGLVGMSYAFALNYVLYFFVIFWATRREWSGVC